MMVLNLAINARDAMPDGGALRIATVARLIAGYAELANGAFIEIVVSDTGTGLDETTLRRAMEPFLTTKPIGKGTRFGLAQIYGSARQVGGAVRIESAVGKGTTVRVLLPCTDQAPQAIVRADGTAATLARRSSKVLLVDDDQDVRSMLASAMENQGYQVTEASDGAAALDLLEHERPELAVIDFAMPGMTGAELARRVAERWPELPILFASGFADTPIPMPSTPQRAAKRRSCVSPSVSTSFCTRSTRWLSEVYLAARRRNGFVGGGVAMYEM